MKTLQSYSTKRTEQLSPALTVGGQGEIVHIIMKNSGFVIDKATPTTSQLSTSKALTIAKQKQTDEAERKTMTQMQVYNRMQQAKLLGKPSNQFPLQKSAILKKENSTLSSLLRYHSPK